MNSKILQSEKERLLNNAYSKSTKKQEKYSFNIFNQFIEKNQKNIFDISNEELDDLVESFFISLRKSDGTKMKSSSLQTFKYSLNRHMKENFNLDILNKHSFPKTNKILHAINVDLKKDGLGNIEHFNKISDDDLKLIFDKLNLEIPQQLQWIMFFIIQYYFCRRGQENIEKFTKLTFKIETDQFGNEYICQNIDELTKNHRQNDTSNTFKAKAYAIPEYEKCPVKIFKLYISKLNPNCDRFWQYIKASFCPEESCWYTGKPIGINTLSSFMKKISQFCKLSSIYSNHCIRVTCISALGELFSENDIKHISGHKSISSLGIYKKKYLTKNVNKCLIH